MLKQTAPIVAAVAMCLGLNTAHAIVIDFTGGSVTRFSAPTPVVTNNSAVYDDADHYVEQGVKFDFIGPAGTPFSYNIGDYYGTGNDVIHGHWASGPFGDMTAIRAEKLDGTAFDLNYVIITTNTSTGGASASGTEDVFLNALADGVSVSASIKIPSDDWGFAGPNTQMFLPSSFDGIKAFTITQSGTGTEVGIGLDEFFIDEPPPGTAVPAPATIALLSLGLVGIGFKRVRSQKAE